MSIAFRIIDQTSTSLGELLLRWRQSPQLPGTDIYEVKLGDHFLMSSLFHEAESQLARLGLAAIANPGAELNVVVGGLGLGYTAAAALDDERLTRLVVIEFLEPVITWHQKGWVPLGDRLCKDSRCVLRHADFFACVNHRSTAWFPGQGESQPDAVLLDIDHSPSHWLHGSNESFYSEVGLTAMRHHIRRGGVFALWADGEPDAMFVNRLQAVFESGTAHSISFENPLTGGVSVGSVYVARC